jgi:hypothetical protein
VEATAVVSGSKPVVLGEEKDLVGRTSPLGGIFEDVVNGEETARSDAARPGSVVGPRGIIAVTTVDKD